VDDAGPVLVGEDHPEVADPKPPPPVATLEELHVSLAGRGKTLDRVENPLG
jgi:hypothetical protein